MSHLQACFDEVAARVRAHHDQEEKLYFPFLAERFTLPPRLSADHSALEQQLGAAGARAKGLRCSDSAAQEKPGPMAVMTVRRGWPALSRRSITKITVGADMLP